MQLTGSRQIAAERAAVWAALTDPQVLRRAIPGCQEMTGDPRRGFHAVVRQKVGPLSATFRGFIAVSNIEEGVACTISAEGKGGAAGFAKGGADVRLEDADGGTRLGYAITADVGGRLARLGSRVIDGFGRKLADRFFDSFQRAVEAPPAQAATASPAPEARRPGWLARLRGQGAGA